MSLKGKKVIVAGLGISGKGAIKLLKKLEADIYLYDENVKSSINFDIKNENIFLGAFPYEILSKMDYIVLSPGISVNVDYSIKAKQQGVKVIGELELAYMCSKGRIAALTGTNGKTTTTALVGEILSDFYNQVYVVGNIGNSFAGVALETKENSIIVAEVSSFQLETVDKFKPEVSAVLNITPDHLDRHGNMENYLYTKMEIAKNQLQKETCVINYDDVLLREASKNLKCRVLYFSCNEKIQNGLYLNQDKIIYNNQGKDELVCKTGELKILGKHNYENVMAATGICLKMGVPMEKIRNTVKKFNAIEHRIEYVDNKNGVIFYNDSKGTNPDASKKAVEAMERPTVLIAGGYDKKADFKDWANSFDEKIKCLILLGETKYKIEEAVRKTGFSNIILVETFEEAFFEAHKNAEDGDAVLLSPACASWGMFKNFEERGNVFKEMVNKL